MRYILFKDLWKKCLIKLKDILSEYEFNMWILPLQAVITTNIIFLFAPNKYVLNYVRKNYLNNINELINIFCKNNIPVINFFIGDKNLNKKMYLKNKNNKIIDNNYVYNSLNFKKFNDCLLLNKYNFSNFIYSKSNYIVYKEILDICNFIKKNYKSLLIYSGTGLGKTHLLQSIANNVNHNNNFKKNVIYINSERFVNKMVNSLNNNSIEEFKLYFKSADILLVDDMQFFSNKDYSQKEFFYILDNLLDNNKFVILTSDIHIKNMNGIDSRLISKLSCGLVLNIDKPDYDLKFKFLLKKSKEMNFFLQDEIINFIANSNINNIYELEGIVHSLLINSNYFNNLNNITIDFVRNIIYPDICLNKISINVLDIQKIVSEYYKLSVIDLLSRSRSKSLVYPRQISIAISKKLTNYSLSELGNFYGGLNHSTIIYSCKRIEKLCIINNKVKSDFYNLIKVVLNFNNEIYCRKRKSNKTIK